ncbi:MAG: hypothetical protein AAGL49_15685, partial [Pseudomonadota bacterium]
MNGYAKIAEAAPAGFAIHVVDAGAAGGLNSRWRPFRSVVAGALFEPRLAGPEGAGPDGAGPDGAGPEGAGPEGTGQAGRTPEPGCDVVFPCGLGADVRQAPLHIAALGNMSSTLPPNTALANR